MYGVSAHVSFTPSLISRCTLRSCFNRAEIFSSSGNRFVTHSALRWSHDTEINGTRRGPQLRREDVLFVDGQNGLLSGGGRGGLG